MSNKLVLSSMFLDIFILASFLLFTDFKVYELISHLGLSGIKVVYFILRKKHFNKLAPTIIFVTLTLVTFFLSFQPNTPTNIELVYLTGVLYLLVVFSDSKRCMMGAFWVISLYVSSKLIKLNTLTGLEVATLVNPHFSEIKAAITFIATISTSILIVYWYLMELQKIQNRSDQYLEEIKLQNTTLAKINDEMEHFTYIASHDLKTPLRLVVSYLGLIRKKLSKKEYDDLDEYLEFAENGATQMFQLMNDILEYSRLSSKESPKTLVDLNDVFEDVQQQMNQVSTDYQILKLNNLPVLLANKAKMKALFQNLIENGLKYNDKEQPKIEINSNELNDELVLEFKDNGIGVDPKYKSKIFEMFKRLHNKEKYQGTGIGLAICKKIVESMNGKIDINSSVGEGSQFVVTFPKGNSFN